MDEAAWQELKARLARSAFRSRFRLSDADRLYIEKRGLPAIQEHAARFVAERLTPAAPRNDGKQTPMRGHPVFVAQHATGACCRSCLSTWQGLPAGRDLTAAEQERVVETLMRWIVEQAESTRVDFRATR